MRRGLGRWLLASLLLLAGAGSAAAHELQPGYLELIEAAPNHYEVTWKQPYDAGGLPLPMTPVFPPNCAESRAPRTLADPAAVVTRAEIACSASLAGAWIGIDGLDALATDVLLRVRHRDGREETEVLKPQAPAVQLALAGAAAPRGDAAYFRLGLEHIALGVDHLLFVLGLLLIVGSARALLQTITAFTLAHSLSLAAATLGWAHVPAPALNAAIALSILFLGPEIVRRWRGGTSLTIRRPWVVAFAFGLLHGFGFASGLSTLGLPRVDIVRALLLFNLGVEAGQLAFVALVYALRWAWRVLAFDWPWYWQRLPGYLVGSCGAYWTIQRLAMW
ncbi:MAG: HupE/UreJ family protein [Burkholderiales bacterium]|nr:HupE/UreJ family protein [Burkholderiales bacterium]